MANNYHKRNKRNSKKSYEFFMDFVAIIGPLVTLPQLVEIWSRGADAGVSIITWGGYLALSLFWLSYGIINKEKPIIIANVLYFVINLIIVIGLLVI